MVEANFEAEYMIENQGRKPKAKRPAFEAFDVSPRHAQICTKHGEKKTLQLLEAEHPGKWVMPAKYFGEPNPGPCHDHPRTHTHFLFYRGL